MNDFIAQLGLIGLGTNDIGCSSDSVVNAQDLSSVRYAFDLGYRVIDTAEMYGYGKTETLLGNAITESRLRDKLYIVSKVMPQNARTKQDIIHSLEKSLSRLRCDYLDSYLLHWREDGMSLDYIIETFLELQLRGKIKSYGISNFRQASLDEWLRIEKLLGGKTSFHQIRYSIMYPVFESNMIPLHNRVGIATMAWRPLDNGLAPKDSRVSSIANKYNLPPSQLALAWAIRNGNVIVIPKSKNKSRLEENFNATNVKLGSEILSDIHKMQKSFG